MLGDIFDYGKGIVKKVQDSDVFAFVAIPLMILLFVLFVLVVFPIYMIVGFFYFSTFIGSGLYFLYSLTFGWFQEPLVENLGALGISFVVFCICFWLSFRNRF